MRARVSTGRARLRSDTSDQVQGSARREKDVIAHPFARKHHAAIPVPRHYSAKVYGSVSLEFTSPNRFRPFVVNCAWQRWHR